jgi:hypothetical protein
LPYLSSNHYFIFLHILQIVILGLSAGFISAARLALPLRMGAAVALTPLVDKYVTSKFLPSTSTENNEKARGASEIP